MRRLVAYYAILAVVIAILYFFFPGEVGRIARHELRVVMLAFAEDDPAHVGPETAVVRGVRISVMVGILMVDAMRRHPEDRSAFERQRSADREEIIQPQRDFVGPVSVQPVVSQAYSKAYRDPVQGHRDRKRAPTEHEQRSNGA